jgi:hypothetical protein
MAKTLRGDHARDFGGVIVEVGEEVPDSADPEVVARLEDEGVVVDEGGGKPKTKREGE